MTKVGSGGVVISTWSFTSAYERQYRKLGADMQSLVDSKLKDLQKDPRPPGLRFEKLSGHRKPYIYSIHITGNYKVSMEIEGNHAHLRKVGNHDDIDRSP